MKRRLIFVTAGLIAASAVGFAQYRGYQASQSEAFQTAAGKAFLETYAAIRQDYLKDVKPETLMLGALSGMIGSLNDEFTFYLPPEASAANDERSKGEFFGIGATLRAAKADGKGARIESVYPGAPAARAGLQAGDVIETVNGASIASVSLTEAVAKIRGPKGTVVQIGVERGVRPLQFRIVRDKVQILNVASTMLKTDDGVKVGYVALADFLNRKSTDQLQAALRDLKAKGARGMVLDLRDNPGGLVLQAQSVADTFLSKGDVFITRDKSKKVQVEYTARPNPTDYSGPLVVLVNANSASASEIVTAALQENGRARVVGEKTYGKGVANLVSKLSNGGQVNVAFEEWLTPKRHSIFKKGVTPDYTVEDSRFPKLLAIEGANAPAGSSVEVKVGGRTLKLKAGADGRFTYQQQPGEVKAPQHEGTAPVDPKTDAELRKALQVLDLR